MKPKRLRGWTPERSPAKAWPSSSARPESRSAMPRRSNRKPRRLPLPPSEGVPVMRRLIEYVAQRLVDQPEAVQVREGRSDRYFTAYHLTVAPDDFGKVIGR